MAKILVTDDAIPSELIQPLREAGHEVTVATPFENVPDDPSATLERTEANLKAALDHIDGYFFGGIEDVTLGALEGNDSLKIISFMGVGWDGFILPGMSSADRTSALQAFGITVTNTPGTLTEAVAELNVAQALNVVRKLSYHAAEFEGPAIKTRDLQALRVGIVGLGNIGTRTARILRKGFDCDVAYFSRTRKADVESELGIKYMDLLALANWADVIILQVTGSVKDLIDDDVVSQFRDGMILINNSKSGVVNSSALLEGLRAGRIGTAVIDGFYKEDPNRDALLEFRPDRLIVTPEIGSNTSDARDPMGALAVQNLLDFFAGNPENVVVAV